MEEAQRRADDGLAIGPIPGGGSASGRANQARTGPRLLTFADAVEEIEAASGRSIGFVPVTIDEYAPALPELGVPDDIGALLTYLFTEVLDGRNAHVTDGVQRVLGRPARDFRDYARGAAAAGAWND